MKQRGFSLLELLIAVAIMSMSLGLLYRMSGGSARNLADSTQQQHALWLAESLLASRSSVPPSGWNEAGVSVGYQWQVSSTPYATSVASTKLIPLHKVKLVIRWSEGTRPGQIELVTLLPQRAPRSSERLS